ncbi:glycosyltransferase [Nitrosomonas communis]|uniref:glycosyltransferase n=1 Tax=Nitrosomonas communis TaxID=44574 RepID=UPI003D28E11D
MPIIGHFDFIHQNHAIGWALLTEQLNKRVEIEIIAGDQLISSGVASYQYKALVEKGVGDGHYGFAIPLPPSMLNDIVTLRARVAGSGEWLKGEHSLPAVPSKPMGSIDGIASGTIFGWVAGEASGKIPDVIIYHGNKKIGHAQIGSLRQDIVTLSIAELAYSYHFDLSPFLKTKPASNQSVNLIHAASGVSLLGCPLSLNETRGWGHASDLDGINLTGWATLSGPVNGIAIVELWIDGVHVLETPADQVRPDIARMGIVHSRCGFKVSIPSRYLDSKPHILQLRYQATQTVLPGGEQPFTFTLRHAITQANATEISGWSFLEQAPIHCLTIEAWENGRRLTQDIAGRYQPSVPHELCQQFGAANAGFRLLLPSAMDINASRRIRLCLAGSTDAINSKDILITPIANLIREIEGAIRSDTPLRWWASDWITKLRHSNTTDGTLYKVVPAGSDTVESLPLDIIVPVYKGREETLACLHSLLAMPETIPYEIIVINDASPDAQLVSNLRDMADRKYITMIENQQNLGFVASVNRGMKLHMERDVLLLNSDTVVPASDWLSRMRAAAQAETMIATVTPFSNRATVCSLPKPNVDNDLPAGLNVTDLDILCAQTNPDIHVDIPTAVGFCMYIKRATLNEVGLFDEERWAKGYGEENDFCIKAASIGWKHVVACNVFVQHHGAVSFQGEKQTRVQENLNRLNALYPDYSTTISQFIRYDRLSTPRNRIVLELMLQAAKQQKIKSHVLHITHVWGGGVQHHVDQLCRLPDSKGSKKGNKSPSAGLILRPMRDGRVEIIQPYSQLALNFSLTMLADISKADADIINILKALKITAIHLHQWIGLPSTIWQLPAVLGVPLDYTVHDYYSFCPRINLIDYTGQYCEQAPISRCTQCVKVKALEAEIEPAFTDLGSSIESWRTFHHAYLSQARNITAPSKDAAQRVQSALSIKHVAVKPHDEAHLGFQPKPLPKSGETLRIAVIGAIGPNKGYEQLLALIQLAEVEAPYFRFYIIGYTMDDTPFDALSNVYITGKYVQSELQNLLTKLDCHIALFLSFWPETYSYTLSEALNAGLMPVVPALGAMGERVAESKLGRLLPKNPTASQILQAIKSLLESTG